MDSPKIETPTVTNPTWSRDTQPEGKRDLKQAMLRGLKGRCPHCGEGRLFGRFLKVVPQCSVCGEDYTPQRADDLPAYITLFIVGHVVVGGMLHVETSYDWPVLWHVIAWPTLTLVLSLGILQPIKGAVVGLQWAVRMHGFGSRPDGDEQAIMKPHPHHL